MEIANRNIAVLAKQASDLTSNVVVVDRQPTNGTTHFGCFRLFADSACATLLRIQHSVLAVREPITCDAARTHISKGVFAICLVPLTAFAIKPVALRGTPRLKSFALAFATAAL